MTREAFLGIVAVGVIRYGGNVLSWIRSPDQNEEVGGHPDSQHMSGLAVDSWYYTHENAESFKRYCDRHGLGTKWNGDKTVHVQALKVE